MATTKRPVLDEAFRNVLRNERQRASREAKRSWERQLNAARNDLARRIRQAGERQRSAPGEALVRSTSQLARAVAASWSVDVPFVIEFGPHLAAWTDFTQVTVRVPQSAVESVQQHDIDAIADVVGLVRGALYHEVGHIRFSVPFMDLCAAAGVDYFLLPNSQRLQHTWNLLEDQRMENLVVDESPVIASYFGVMAIQAFFDKPDAKNWLLLMRRPWVPVELRRTARRACINEYGIDKVSQSERLLNDYFKAESATEAFAIITAFEALWNEPLPFSSGSQPRGTRYRWDNRPQAEGETKRILDHWKESGKKLDGKVEDEVTRESEDDGDTDGSDSDTGTGDINGPINVGPTGGAGQPGRGEGQAKTEPGEGEGQGTKPTDGRGHATHGSGEKVQDAISENTESMIDASSTKAEEIKAKVRQQSLDIARQINADSVNPLDLPPHPSTGLLAAEEYAKALAVASEMEHSFNVAMADRAPSWHRREETGVLDALAYKTRERGDTDYWNRWDEGGSSSPDLAVSVVLDVSWSMDGHQHHLGSAAFAIKAACDAINVPCTVSTFADSAYLVWTADQPAEPMSLGMAGGTDPTQAMDALQSQRAGKRSHLVVVVTDGEFGDFPGFRSWATTGMSILGVAFGYSEYLLESLERQGADECVLIGDLAKLPPLVEHHILAHLV